MQLAIVNKDGEPDESKYLSGLALATIVNARRRSVSYLLPQGQNSNPVTRAQSGRCPAIGQSFYDAAPVRSYTPKRAIFLFDMVYTTRRAIAGREILISDIPLGALDSAVHKSRGSDNHPQTKNAPPGSPSIIGSSFPWLGRAKRSFHFAIMVGHRVHPIDEAKSRANR
jgi:hypothetical protein